MLRVFCFGNPRLEIDGAPGAVRPASPVLALLAYLLLHRHVPLLRQSVAFTFWPDGDEVSALARLRRVLFSLNETLPHTTTPWVLANKRTIGWNPRAEVWLDVAEFDRLRAAADGGIDALALYQGEFLPDVDAEWIRAQRDTLAARYAETLATVVRRLRDAGDVSTALTYAQRHLAADPLREEAVRTVMELRAAGGDRSGAAQTYAAFAARAKDELAVEPSPETVATMEQIAGTPDRPRRTLTNMPESKTSFIGRTYDVDSVRALLRGEGRLLTITGPGGVGKSRLALEASRAAHAQFRDGVWLVELAQVSDPRFVLGEVARPFGVVNAPRESLREAVVRAMRSRELLLVLDNCEHLLTSAGEVVDLLLRACPRIRVLATSRERLRLSGETTYVLPTLAKARDPIARASDAMQFSAIELFVDRARTLEGVNFRISDQNAGAVARIVSRTDGIPLAVELAVPWLRVLSVEELAGRLEDRFGVLVGGGRTSPARHRTLEGLIAWSYDSLSDDARQLFGAAATFPGGFSVEAMAAVLREDGRVDIELLQLVSELLDTSLINALDGESRRFIVLDTLREYGLRRQTAALQRDSRSRHAAFYCEFARRIEVARRGGAAESQWLAPLEAERHNFYAALAWCLDEDGDPRVGTALAFALSRFFEYEDRAERRRWYVRALDRLDPSETELRADAALGLQIATKDELVSDRVAALEAVVAVYRAGGDRLKLHYALGWLSWALSIGGRFPEAASVARECTVIAREAGSAEDIAWGLRREVDALIDTDPESASAKMEQAREALSDAPPTRAKLGTLRQTAELYLYRGDRVAAMNVLIEARAVTARLASVSLNVRAPIDNYYAALAALAGDIDDGRAVALDVVGAALSEGSEFVAVCAIDTLAFAAAKSGDFHRAARLSGYVEDRLRRSGFPDTSIQRPCSGELTPLLAARFPEDELSALKQHGASWSDAQAAGEARGA